MERNLKAIVLAAGKGTRLRTGDSDMPKVMRPVHGKPLLRYVLDALSFIPREDIVIVAGYKKEDVINHFRGYSFAVQTEQLGTGHAVMAAHTEFRGFNGSVLVCCGDMPLIKKETYEALSRAHFEQDNGCTILTGQTRLPLPYGRIIRDKQGAYLKIAEEKDCTEEQLNITELNSGVYIFQAQPLFTALKSLKNNNAQGEYYLTDVPSIMSLSGSKVGVYTRELGNEIIGVNTAAQLNEVSALLAQ